MRTSNRGNFRYALRVWMTILLTIQRKSLNEEMAGSEYRRSNPDVFSYAIGEKPEKDVTIIEMIFFWRAPPVVFYHPGAEHQIF
jgi:hypothetical protein